MDLKRKMLLVGVLVLGLGFRLYGINWDENQHLHPDERFLTMVMTDMKLPRSWGEYVDTHVSTFNPNNIGHNFFVYGTAPLIANKLLAVALGNDSYNGLTLQGRVLSAIADGMTILVVFLIARLLTRKYKLGSSLPYWSAFFYAIAVSPIQMAHFFAVDSFLILCGAWSLWGGLKYWETGKVGWLAWAGGWLGLGIACKLSAVLIVPLLLMLIGIKLGGQVKVKEGVKSMFIGGVGLIVLIMTGHIAVRMADPYLFTKPRLWQLEINPQFVSSIKTLESFNGNEVWFPPAIQWMSTVPVWYAIKNIGAYGLGWGYFGLMWLGLGTSVWQAVRYRRWVLGLLTLWWLAYFGYQSTQFVKALRYFSLLYPLAAVFAGMGITWLFDYLKRRMGVGWMIVGVVVMLMIWPIAFMSVYVKPHSRITASEWIYENVTPASKVVNEHWDDPLPLLLPEYAGIRINGEMLPVFDQDTDIKWEGMYGLLDQADYYFLTSNRAWGSIPKVPWKYPQMSRFYQQLLNGELEFKKVAEFTSYPSLRYLGLPIDFPDDNADETFTVYDHPKVIIMKRK